eukprot:scaffold2866_cov256-Skeletonema_marinoi.AAC.1
MDMTVSIEGNKITTTLFEKELALYQYLPPNSSHPPGVLTGLVMGGVSPSCTYSLIFNMISNQKESKEEPSHHDGRAVAGRSTFLLHPS